MKKLFAFLLAALTTASVTATAFAQEAAPSATLLKERVGLRKLLFRAGAAAGLLLLAAALVLL